MMTESSESHAPMIAMLFFMIIVQLLALAFMPSFEVSNARVFENPSSPENPIIYVLLIVGFTLLLLIALRLKQGWVIGGFILISVAVSIFYILSAFLPLLLSLVLTAVMLLLLRFYPEWYVIDIVGIFICAGISALFGISLTTLPAVLLLAILAVYDAISVYKTGHMVTLAEGVISIKAPLLFVVPKAKGYSFRENQVAISDASAKKERGAYFLGLGDAIMPTILVISANWSLSAPGLYGVNIPAMGAMIGTYLGFLALLTTSRDKPQAGLPFLDSGAILGFLAGCALAGVWPF
jgi:presenilin-like A22 family membrane protease